MAQPQAGLPLFDGDRFANGITGTTSLSFEEADCSTSLFEACLPDPCMNGGRCYPAMTSVAGKPDFACDCTNDWEGKTCETPNAVDDDGGQGQSGGGQEDNYVLADDVYDEDDDEFVAEGPDPNSTRSDGSAATAGGSDFGVSFYVTVLGVVVGIAILVVSVVHCRRGSAPAAQSGDATSKQPSSRAGKTFVNPMYGESSTTLARPGSKIKFGLKEGDEEVASGFNNV